MTTPLDPSHLTEGQSLVFTVDKKYSHKLQPIPAAVFSGSTHFLPSLSSLWLDGHDSVSCHPELSPYIVDYRGPPSVCNCTEQLETLQVREKEREGGGGGGGGRREAETETTEIIRSETNENERRERGDMNVPCYVE